MLFPQPNCHSIRYPQLNNGLPASQSTNEPNMNLSETSTLTVVDVDAAGGGGEELVQRHGGGRLRGGGGGGAHLPLVVVVVLRLTVETCHSGFEALVHRGFDKDCRWSSYWCQPLA